MAYLLLVRHSLPEIVPERPARQWRLSAAGRVRCRPLAEKLAIYEPERVITSLEPKAQETGRLIAEHLGLAWETAAGLHEHEREQVPFLDQDAWERLVADFFARPDELVLGSETAVQARQRFAAAVQQVLDRFPEQTVVIVSHGTVMSLLVADRAGIDPLPFWQSLALPDLVVLQRPELALAAQTGKGSGVYAKQQTEYNCEGCNKVNTFRRIKYVRTKEDKSNLFDPGQPRSAAGPIFR